MKKKSMQLAFKKFGKSTTTHGVGHVVSEGSVYIRVFWLVLTLASTGMLIFQLQKIGRSFLAKSTLTSFSKSDVDRHVFPTLTFCGGSILRKAHFPGEPPLFRNTSIQLRLLAHENLFGVRTLHSLQYLAAFDGIDQLRHASVNGRHFFLSKLKSSCIFGIHSYCDYPTNFTDFLTSSYGGLCFQMNANGDMAQESAGSYFGLSMIIFANQSDYLPFSSLDIGSGIMLKMHQPGEFPFPEIDAVAISTGFITRISLTKVKIQRLKAPYPSNCTDGDDIELLYPGKYTISNCKRSCLAKDALNRCGSTDPVTLMILNRTKASLASGLTQHEMACIYDSARTSTKNAAKCVCPVPCKEVFYQPTITQTKWPAKADLPYYKKAFAYALDMPLSKMTDEFVYDNFLSLNIYFDEMSYQTMIEKKEWTFEKVIADVGGQMGVWIGASVLSLFELGIFAISVIRKTFSKKRKARKITVLPAQDLKIQQPN